MTTSEDQGLRTPGYQDKEARLQRRIIVGVRWDSFRRKNELEKMVEELRGRMAAFISPKNHTPSLDWKRCRPSMELAPTRTADLSTSRDRWEPHPSVEGIPSSKRKCQVGA